MNPLYLSEDCSIFCVFSSWPEPRGCRLGNARARDLHPVWPDQAETCLGDAREAIARLGTLAHKPVNFGIVFYVGQSLDWPEWLVAGTGIAPGVGAPARLTLHDKLIAAANLCDRAGVLELATRVLHAPLAAIDPRCALAFQVAPDLDAALARFAVAIDDAAPQLRVCYSRGPDAGTLEVRSGFVPGRLHDALALATLALCYRLAEAMSGKVAHAARLSASAAGVRQRAFSAELLCPVRFASGGNRLTLPATLLAEPNPRHDPELWESLASRAAGQRDAVAPEKLKTMLIGRICRDLDERRTVPRLKQLAGELDMSERTIIRLLSGEGTSFRQLVDDERMRRAMRLVGDRSLELARVADLLGFADAPSFWRTFRRWYGVTPSAFRR